MDTVVLKIVVGVTLVNAVVVTLRNVVVMTLVSVVAVIVLLTTHTPKQQRNKGKGGG